MIKKIPEPIKLGDWAEKLIFVTGINKIVKKITGEEECNGCKKRKEYLNNILNK